MQKFYKVLCALALVVVTQFVQAGVLKYEIQQPTHQYNPAFPGLDLNNLNLIKVTAVESEFSPEVSISRVEFVFQNASNLIVSNFKKDGNIYRGLVNGAWVYKQVLVEVEVPSQLEPNAQLRTRIMVVENQSFLNNTGFTHGFLTLEAEGALFDVSANPVADTAWLKVDNKGLSMKLYQRATFDHMTGRQGFKIYTNWMGHGERELYINTPFPPSDYGRFKAKAIKIDTHVQPDGEALHMISIDYEDQGGATQSTPFEDLKMHLDQVYPPAA
ncbi:hypothetical protein [Aliikangiella coralliicola]|uniref:Outer membrane lipoprotein-sorting protein n=1 Tax=Aliikangiella coralliicola TaxID=2592383 RepID=A0A545UGF7_9GAMM|nr:hypothetical protein [Aliikangiella coralliicola]TQV88551.1 hypothetical protein FLL46_08515 [Aliikangiella coralliicola]